MDAAAPAAKADGFIGSGELARELSELHIFLQHLLKQRRRSGLPSQHFFNKCRCPPRLHADPGNNPDTARRNSTDRGPLLEVPSEWAGLHVLA